MNSEVLPLNALSATDRQQSKALARQLGTVERSRTLSLAKLESAAQIQASKVHAVGFVGQQAMQAVAMVSQLEQQLGQACPLAVTRLQGIADMTALSMAQVVADTARKFG